jgi:mannose-6-phosphate isomerase
LKENESNTIVNCPYFTTNFIPLIDSATISKTGDSFTVYMCIDGAFEIEYNKDLYQYKRRYGSNPAMDYYVINGKLLF